MKASKPAKGTLDDLAECSTSPDKSLNKYIIRTK